MTLDTRQQFLEQLMKKKAAAKPTEKPTYSLTEYSIAGALVNAPLGWFAVFRQLDESGHVDYVWEEPVVAWCMYRERRVERWRESGNVSATGPWRDRQPGGVYRDTECGLLLAEQESNFIGYRAPTESREEFWRHR